MQTKNPVLSLQKWLSLKVVKGKITMKNNRKIDSIMLGIANCVKYVYFFSKR